MKITEKQLQILSGFLFLVGICVIFLTRNYNTKHSDDPIAYGRWLGIGIMIAGLVLLMPWIKKKGK